MTPKTCCSRTIADKVKYRKRAPAYEVSTAHEGANGFTTAGRDCRGYLPMVEALSWRLVAQARTGGLSSECWSLALRLAAARLDKERRTA